MYDNEFSSSRSCARLAGSLYILIGIVGVFSIIWVPFQLTVPEDPVGTAFLINSRSGLFFLGVGASLVLMIAEIILSVLLFVMFQSYGSILAMCAASFRLMMVAVMAAMLLPQAGILALIDTETQLIALNADQRAEFAWILRQIHDSGILVWQVFFTFHLWFIGILARRTNSVPRILSWGLIIGGAGYLFASIHTFLLPESTALAIVVIVLLLIATFGEIGLAIWLLYKGKIEVNTNTNTS